MPLAWLSFAAAAVEVFCVLAAVSEAQAQAVWLLSDS